MNFFKITDEKEVRLYEIAAKMKDSGLDANFLSRSVNLAKIHEEAFDLFCSWAEEEGRSEIEKIISAISEDIHQFKDQTENYYEVF